MSQVIAIQELARQVRESTLKLLNMADPGWLTSAPSGTSNHVLWHAGHALWLQDTLCLQPLTGKNSLPQDWDKAFGMDCQPVKTQRQWPAREQIAELLRTQLDEILATIEHAGEAKLAGAANTRGDTLGSRIIHGFHDEARHQGEMYLLIKMRRASDNA